MYCGLSSSQDSQVCHSGSATDRQVQVGVVPLCLCDFSDSVAEVQAPQEVLGGEAAPDPQAFAGILCDFPPLHLQHLMPLKCQPGGAHPSNQAML